MQYLLIQNPGQAPIEGYTTYGVSLTRFHGSDQTIGKFGSGSKLGVNLLLRNGYNPVIFCGPTRLEFGTKSLPVDDGLARQDFNKVFCRISGKTDDGTINRTIDCGWTTEHGVNDWKTVDMALREFVSNALDRTIRQENDFRAALKDGRLAVKVVDEAQVRAKTGFTRVFLPFENEIIQFYAQLGRRFLHFSEPENLNRHILPKTNRNLSANKRVAMIYLNGVFVREIESDKSPSVFDYNFSSSQLEIDEARNVDDWRVKNAAAELLREATPEEIAKVFDTIIHRDSPYWEHSLDRDYLSTAYVYDDERKKKITENWKKGWEIAAGSGILCRNEQYLVETVRKKGYHAVPIPAECDAWVHAAQRNDVPSSLTVMTKFEAEGKQVFDPTPGAIKAVDSVWNWLEQVQMTQGKTKPQVKCFRTIMQAGGKLCGYYHDGVVYLNEDAASGDLNKELLHTALEEVVHYITGATDMSRDFQNYLLQVIVELQVKGVSLRANNETKDG